MRFVHADKAVPPAPMPQDKGGWRVAPAPDGRGMPQEHKARPPHRLRGFWIFVLVLLTINWLSVLLAQPSGQPRPAGGREGAGPGGNRRPGGRRRRGGRRPGQGGGSGNAGGGRPPQA